MEQLPSKQELKGLQLGVLGVLIFSLTLPASRVAVTELDPVFVGLGRAIIAGVLAGILLTITRQSLPPKRFWLRFLLVAALNYFCFSNFTTRTPINSHPWLYLGSDYLCGIK